MYALLCLSMHRICDSIWHGASADVLMYSLVYMCVLYWCDLQTGYVHNFQDHYTLISSFCLWWTQAKWNRFTPAYESLELNTKFLCSSPSFPFPCLFVCLLLVFVSTVFLPYQPIDLHCFHNSLSRTITQSGNVTIFMMAEWSQAKNSYQSGDPQSCSWEGRRKRYSVLCLWPDPCR